MAKGGFQTEIDVRPILYLNDGKKVSGFLIVKAKPEGEFATRLTPQWTQILLVLQGKRDREAGKSPSAGGGGSC